MQLIASCGLVLTDTKIPRSRSKQTNEYELYIVRYKKVKRTKYHGTNYIKPSRP